MSELLVYATPGAFSSITDLPAVKCGRLSVVEEDIELLLRKQLEQMQVESNRIPVRIRIPAPGSFVAQILPRGQMWGVPIIEDEEDMMERTVFNGPWELLMNPEDWEVLKKSTIKLIEKYGDKTDLRGKLFVMFGVPVLEEHPKESE